MASVPAEKRRFPRLELHTELHYQVRGLSETNNTISDDLSANGVSFSSNGFISPGTAVMLEINLLSRVLRPIGRIAWSTPFPHSDRYKSGAEFLELDQKDKDYLSDYIELQRGSP
jgi:hypothetical protein